MFNRTSDWVRCLVPESSTNLLLHKYPVHRDQRSCTYRDPIRTLALLGEELQPSQDRIVRHETFNENAMTPEAQKDNCNHKAEHGHCHQEAQCVLWARPKRYSGHELCVAASNPVERKKYSRQRQNGQGNEDVPQRCHWLKVERGKEEKGHNERYDDPIRDQEFAEIGNNRVTHAEYE